MDFLYGFFKVISMVATGAFGALGLLTKYRDDDNKITKSGKIALGGILLSLGLSLGIYVLETSKAKAAAEQAKAEAEATKKSLGDILGRAEIMANRQELNLTKTGQLQFGMEEALKKQELNLQGTNKIAEDMRSSIIAQRILLTDNEKILDGLTSSISKQKTLLNQTKEISLNVNRSLFPFGEFKASFGFSIPFTHPLVKNYYEYLESQVKRLLPQFQELHKNAKPDEGIPFLEGLSIDQFKNSRRSDAEIRVFVSPPSPHVPSYETPEGKLLNRYVFIVSFFKPPFDINAIENGKYRTPDLEMWVTAFADSPNNNQNRLFFILDSLNSEKKGFLTQGAEFVRTSGQKQTAMIPSLLDFGGTLVVVRFINGLDKMVKFTELRLHQPTGTCLKIEGKLFQRIDQKPFQRGNFFSNSTDTIFFQILPNDMKMTVECSPSS